MSTGHVRLVHQNCQTENCGYCLGGLMTCAVCFASEGELPLHCPGRKMIEREKDDVMAGRLEYVDNEWFRKPSEEAEAADALQAHIYRED